VRDGIYKDLPQPRAWKGLLRSCTREAERGDPANHRASRAVAADCDIEITASFLRRFRRRADDAALQLPGVGSFDGIASSRDIGGENTPLENLMIEHARRLERGGITGDHLTTEAMTAALEDWKERRFRHMAQHCVTKAGDGARPTLAAVRQALDAQDLRGFVARRLAGERAASPAAARPIDLDEDLANPR